MPYKPKSCCHWKRQPNSLVMATVEGKVNGKARRGRRRTGWIENVRRTTGSMTAAKAQTWKASGHGSTMVCGWTPTTMTAIQTKNVQLVFRHPSCSIERAKESYLHQMKISRKRSKRKEVQQQQYNKEYNDKRRNTRSSDIKVGDNVLVRQQKNRIN